jgi:group I intron endonuclease
MKIKVEVERRGCIYLLLCLVNGKCYVGQTVRNPELRWAEHIWDAYVKRDRRPLYCAIRKYGLKNFTAQVVYQCVESKLNAAERRFVRLHRSYIANSGGYNLTTGGGQFKMSPATCRKLHRWAKRFYNLPENRLKLSRMQAAAWAWPGARESRKFTPEQAARRDINVTKALRRPSVGRRLSAAQTIAWANDPNRRARQSRKLKAAHRRDPSARKRVGMMNRGRKHSKRAKRALSKAAKAQWADPVLRAAMLESLRRGAAKRWARKAERDKAARNTTLLWTKTSYRKKTSKSIKLSHGTPEYHKRASDAANLCHARRQERKALKRVA